MDPIQKAIEEIESRKLGEEFSYKKVAEKHGLNRTTLAQRHKGIQASYAAAGLNQMKLNPQQEVELVQYIETLTKRGLPPTRKMIQNFASCVAKEALGEGWVTRFINRNK
ncbi:hypothetical protein EJ02DRAFT_482733, partial [Clathrospora elynae]